MIQWISQRQRRVSKDDPKMYQRQKLLRSSQIVFEFKFVELLLPVPIALSGSAASAQAVSRDIKLERA